MAGNYKRGLLIIDGHMYNISVLELECPEIHQDDTVTYRDDAGHKVCISLDEYLALKKPYPYPLILSMSETVPIPEILTEETRVLECPYDLSEN